MRLVPQKIKSVLDRLDEMIVDVMPDSALSPATLGKISARWIVAEHESFMHRIDRASHLAIDIAQRYRGPSLEAAQSRLARSLALYDRSAAGLKATAQLLEKEGPRPLFRLLRDISFPREQRLFKAVAHAVLDAEGARGAAYALLDRAIHQSDWCWKESDTDNRINGDYENAAGVLRSLRSPHRLQAAVERYSTSDIPVIPG